MLAVKEYPEYAELRRSRQAAWAEERGLRAEARRLGRWIQPELRRFAAARWPGGRWWGRFGMRPFRLRRRFEPGQVVWWVERDIPPYDRFTCQAYEVRLALDQGRPLLAVCSGAGSRALPVPDAAALQAALARAGQDPPLTIPRRMGVPDEL
jgi:hypothetical protein